MPDRTEYTIAEILDILREISSELIDEELGSDSDFLKLPIEVYMGDWGLNQGMIAREKKSHFSFISSYFGFERPWEEWKPLMKCDATVGQLAAFIADYAKRTMIRPRCILGRDCLEAGIFDFLRETTDKITGEAKLIRPSTPLREALKKHQQEELASRLGFYFPDTLFSDSGMRRGDDADHPFVLASLLIGCLIAGSFCLVPGKATWSVVLIAAAIGGPLLSAFPAILFLILTRVFSVGPSIFAPTIRTYRDLVKFLAAQRNRRGIEPPAPPQGEPYTPAEVLSVLRDESHRVFKQRWRTEADFATEAIARFTHERIPISESPQHERISFLRSLERKFQFRCTEDDWKPLLGSEATMGDLAAFVAQRATHETIRPRRILGRSCLDAGIFQFLKETTAKLTGKNQRIGPSTPMPDVLNRSQLRKLADQANTFFPGINERNSKLWRAKMNWFWVFLLGAVGFTAAAFAGLPLLVESGPLYYLASILIGGPIIAFVLHLLIRAIAFCTGAEKSPFAQSIRTYRDLVKFLAARNGRRFVRCEPA